MQTYYEHLQAEAEQQGSAVTSASAEHQQTQQLRDGRQVDTHSTKAAVKSARPKQAATGLPPRPGTTEALRQKPKAAAPLPSVRPHARNSQNLQQKQQQQHAVDGKVGKASKKGKSADSRQAQQGSGVLDTSNEAGTVQGYQAATNSSQQRQRVKTQSRKADTAAAAAATNAAVEAAAAADDAVSSGGLSERAQQSDSRAAKSPRTAASQAPPQSQRGHPSAYAGGCQFSASASTAGEGSGTAHPLDEASSAVRGGHCPSNQLQSDVTGAEKGSSAGQQQVSRLTAANTALLSELVDMQVLRFLAASPLHVIQRRGLAAPS